MKPQLSNESTLVHLIVSNLINLVTALCWASSEAIEENMSKIIQAKKILEAIIARAEHEAAR